MPYLGTGLVVIVVGLLLSLGSDSPDTLEQSETLGLLLLVVGAGAVITGIVIRVVQVNRADQRRP
jgi:hypothetical protein